MTQVVTDIGRFCWEVWPTLNVTPDVPTVCVVGDGGDMMGLLELSTAVRRRLPAVVIINDNCYGAEHRKLTAVGLAPGTRRSGGPNSPLSRGHWEPGR